MTVMSLPATPWTNGQTTTDGRFYYDSSAGGVGAWRSTPLPVGGLPAGSIMAWGTNTPPANWLLADGSAVSRSTYSSLFAVIGTQYGTGDGSTTFNLPDLRGRVPVGKNTGTFGTLGSTGGAESHVHGSSTMIAGAYAGYWKVRTGSTWTATNSGGLTAPGASSTSNNAGPSIEGNTDSASSLPPYQVVNYIIKASAGWTAGDSELATRVGSVESRATALETANATSNKAGMVPIIPASVTVGSGSASVASDGTVTFSGCNYFDLSSVFSSTYANYKVIFETVNVTSADTLLAYVLLNGVTANGSNFTYQRIYGQNSTLGTVLSSGQVAGGIGVITGLDCSAELTLYRPNKTQYTLSQSATVYLRNETSVMKPFIEQFYSSLADTTAYNGIRFYDGAGSISGKLKIYGLR